LKPRKPSNYFKPELIRPEPNQIRRASLYPHQVPRPRA